MCHSNILYISEHIQVAPQAIENLLYVLDYRERCIKHIFTLAVTHIIQSTEYVYWNSVNASDWLTFLQIYKRPHSQWPQQQFFNRRSNAGCLQSLQSRIRYLTNSLRLTTSTYLYQKTKF